MKRWIWIAVAVAVLAIIVIASVAGGGEKGVEVYVEKVQRRDIESVVSAPGQIDPKLKVNISAHVIGRIEKLYFEEGQVVQKGDRLVDLEKINFRAAAEQASSAVASQRIAVQRSQNNLENARRNLERARSLNDQGISSQELLDRATLEYDTARTALASAEEGVRQAQAALRQASEDLQRTTIVAPISGRIVQKNAEEGEVVITGTMNNPGSVIAVLADLSEILVEADVGETEVVRVALGQQARIRVDAIPDVEFQGAVAEIGSSATQRAGVATGIRYFKVKIGILDAGERLRPGMTAQVDIITEQAPQALSVPVQSVVERDPEDIAKNRAPSRSSGNDEPKEKYAFVIEGGQSVAKKVTTGISNATHVVITSGLAESDGVISGPFRTLRNLKNGEAVRVETESSSARQTEEDDDEEESSDEEQD
ncbi:MAG TPA: efflux RND transporter periplasmic adaptor subunit [Thermoanaerobaculia bacterium]|nr:efflux RND transporter periplasmic adaptor subunit [Thermoanaerobaculia bacterium]